MADPAHAPHPDSLAHQRVGVKVQYIKDLSFSVPRAPDIYVAIRAQPRTTLNLDVTTRPITGHAGTHEVTLALRVEATDMNAASDTPGAVEFHAELHYAGLFTMDNVPDDAVDEALLVECPHILYPFACNILADVTRDANFPPLQLQAIDFARLWQDKRQRQGTG